jgi:hypothetical protein
MSVTTFLANFSNWSIWPKVTWNIEKWGKYYEFLPLLLFRKPVTYHLSAAAVVVRCLEADQRTVQLQRRGQRLNRHHVSQITLPAPRWAAVGSKLGRIQTPGTIAAQAPTILEKTPSVSRREEGLLEKVNRDQLILPNLSWSTDLDPESDLVEVKLSVGEAGMREWNEGWHEYLQAACTIKHLIFTYYSSVIAGMRSFGGREVKVHLLYDQWPLKA